MLYISTSLQSFEAADAEPTASDILRDEVVYRRLDPAFYAWLRQRMTVAEKAKRSGKLKAATFDQLRDRFNPIHTWAVEHLGQDALLAAIRKHEAKSYAPPSIETVERPTWTSPPPNSVSREMASGLSRRRFHLMPSNRLTLSVIAPCHADGPNPVSTRIADGSVSPVDRIMDLCVSSVIDDPSVK